MLCVVREEGQDAHPGRASRRPGGRWALPTRGTGKGTMGNSSENHQKQVKPAGENALNSLKFYLQWFVKRESLWLFASNASFFRATGRKTVLFETHISGIPMSMPERSFSVNILLHGTIALKGERCHDRGLGFVHVTVSKSIICFYIFVSSQSEELLGSLSRLRMFLV